MSRNLKDYFVLSLKGMAMGAADVVPGVSGGTIAFITGIYEELLTTIGSVNLASLKVLKTKGVKAFWTHINANFLVALLGGIAISIISLAQLITYLLDYHAVLVWSFFFGLIISSIYLVGKAIKKWDVTKIIGLLGGAAIAFYITILPPMENPQALWYVFLSGAIAICAMILPGISGSFMLLLLGSYELILGAIKDLKMSIIALFAAGCVTGLLSFSKVLNWMFKKYHDLTVSILTGFLVGSLNKIWPWKNTLSYRINSHGESVPFIQENISPLTFSGDHQLVWAILLAFLGCSIILLMEKLGPKS